VTTHAQKPDFVFRRKGRVHLNRRGGGGGGGSVQSTTGSRGVRTSGSNAGYTKFRGRVKSLGFPLHSPVSPSLPLPCVTVLPSHFNWTVPFEYYGRGLRTLRRQSVDLCLFTLRCYRHFSSRNYGTNSRLSK